MTKTTALSVRLVEMLMSCLLLLGLPDASAHAGTAKAQVAQSTSEMIELAARYENGEGVNRDYARAREIYCQAAVRENPTALLSLGWMYFNGRGVAPNDSIAAHWFTKAAKHGIPQAINLMKMLSGVEPSAQDGCPIGSAKLGSHLNGLPIEMSELIRHESATAGVDPNLVLAIIEIESQFNPRAVSPRNAQGLMQLMPETALRLHVTNTFDPQQNIRGGTIYLRWLLDRFDGNLKLALAAYNAGENTVAAHHGIPDIPETTKYVTDVTRLYLSLTSSTTEGVPDTSLRSASGKKQRASIER